MFSVFLISFKGVLRDKLYQGIVCTAVIFLTIPAASTFSLRQVAALATTLSLSLTSFILLLISVFLGGTSLWKDIERKYVYSTLGMPITRTSYLLGKYFGIIGFVLITALFLAIMTVGAIWFAAAAYPPDRPILWNNIAIAIFFDALKYSLLIAIAFVLSSVSTSFFLPIFGTIATYLAGSATQEVFDYIHTDQGQQLSVVTIQVAKYLYYILPNFSAFDLSSQATYGLTLNSSSLLLITSYGVSYIGIILGIACLLFSQREMQ
ncbi:hypothetical protein UWK_02273 [Desulfocapsa sulfexigens DSM 10523]|uniref:ABC-type transport system involved in multi-copper enzyme maturation, permease component n=1 Tax=Desulfocapsa sulfexigens (strain DSM 10523 / SB164P1) TaxID=1167006 RepID=M1P5N8_DESSD|nr:ABC transporter permease [Desulfocapsa sulfexigens]AGF78813.1 hypothetical protein UWK_02273 [Desulfocapsa sulfexigens DSM 10523]